MGTREVTAYNAGTNRFIIKEDKGDKPGQQERAQGKRDARREKKDQ